MIAAMTISLTPEFEKFVEEQVKSGRYASNSEVIRAGLRALEEQQLRAWLQEGIDALERGERAEAKTIVARLRARLPSSRTTKSASPRDVRISK